MKHAIVAHAVYIRIDSTRAEVAFEVADRLRGGGIATILLAHLAEVANLAGIAFFEATVLRENRRMLQVFHDSGFPTAIRSTEEGLLVELPTAFTEEALASFEERERIAAAAAVAHFLRPSSVAVIGASRRRGTVGGGLLHNLLEGNFAGAVHAVNPSAKRVQGLPAHSSVLDVEGDVELAVVAVAAERVLDVARECADKGVRGLLVVSGGFAEAGPDGLRRQKELVGVCRDAGMRLVGPNCLGVLNTDSPAQRDVRPEAPTARQHRPALTERRRRACTDRGGRGAWYRALILRLERQQGRHLGQRPARVLGGRQRDRRRSCSTSSRSGTRGVSPA